MWLQLSKTLFQCLFRLCSGEKKKKKVFENIRGTFWNLIFQMKARLRCNQVSPGVRYATESYYKLCCFSWLQDKSGHFNNSCLQEFQTFFDKKNFCLEPLTQWDWNTSFKASLIQHSSSGAKQVCGYSRATDPGRIRVSILASHQQICCRQENTETSWNCSHKSMLQLFLAKVTRMSFSQNSCWLWGISAS